MRSRPASLFVVLFFLASASLLRVGTAHASEQQISCGDTIVGGEVNDEGKRLAKLTSHLTCDSGLRFGNDGVELDLNGYTFSGGCDDTLGEGPGIRTNGYSKVSIKNGTIRCWDTGILIDGVPLDPTEIPNAIGPGEFPGDDPQELLGAIGPGTATGGGNTVSGVTIQSTVADPSRVGITPAGGALNDNAYRIMARPHALDDLLGFGILIAGSSENTIESNTLKDNGQVAQIAVAGLQLSHYVIPAENNQIIGNSVENADPKSFPVPRLSQTPDPRFGDETIHTGIQLSTGAIGTVVRGNTVTRSGLDGISDVPLGVVKLSRRFSLLAEATEPGTEPAGVESKTTVIEKNVVYKNGHGQPADGRPGDGIRITQLSGATIQENQICGNAGNGVYVETGANRILDNDVGAGTPACDKNGDRDLRDEAGASLVDVGEPKAQTPEALPESPPEIRPTYASAVNGAKAAMQNTIPCGLNDWTGNFTDNDKDVPPGPGDDDTASPDCVKSLSDADLSLSVGNPGLFRSGKPGTLPIEVTNAGPNRADEVTLNITGEGLTLHGQPPQTDGSYECSQASGTSPVRPIKCRRGIALDAEQKESIEVPVEFGDAGDGKKDVETGIKVRASQPGSQESLTRIATVVAMRKLTVQRSGFGSGTVRAPGVDCGDDCTEDYDHGAAVELTAQPASNSTFGGWSNNCNPVSADPPKCTVTMDAARTVTATFDTDKRRLSVIQEGTGSGTVDVKPDGESCGPGCSDHDLGSAVSLTARADPGSSFKGWGGACSSSGSADTCELMMAANRSVKATFNRLTEPLSVKKEGSGTGSITSTPAGISCSVECSEQSHEFSHGTEVTLTAAHDPTNMRFAGWSNNCNPVSADPPKCEVTMDAAKTVTATFNRLQRLTVARSGSGTGTVSAPGVDCGDDCTEQYDHGSTVKLAALPAKGSTFSGWTGACSGTAACSLAMDGAKTVTAAFVKTTTQGGSSTDEQTGGHADGDDTSGGGSTGGTINTIGGGSADLAPNAGPLSGTTSVGPPAAGAASRVTRAPSAVSASGAGTQLGSATANPGPAQVVNPPAEPAQDPPPGYGDGVVQAAPDEADTQHEKQGTGVSAWTQAILGLLGLAFAAGLFVAARFKGFSAFPGWWPALRWWRPIRIRRGELSDESLADDEPSFRWSTYRP